MTEIDERAEVEELPARVAVRGASGEAVFGVGPRPIRTTSTPPSARPSTSAASSSGEVSLPS